MTDADGDAADGNGPRPLFYERPEVLEAGRHGHLGLAPHDGYAFARDATSLPLNVAEFARAAVTYPIVFAGRGDRLSPVAVTGLRRGENLFVDAAGAWAEDAYVPGYARRHPFMLARTGADEGQVALCADMASPRLVAEGGRPLFEDGRPARAAEDALEFCVTYQRQALASELIADTLRELGVLEPQEGEITLGTGESLQLVDFHVVDEAALNALSDADWLRLRACGGVAAAYCHVVSLNNWTRLSRLAEARRRP